jgi:peptide/nickel transport system ATP-binding protein
VIVDGTDLLSLTDAQMLKARLSKIAYIPQGAMNSLNPILRIGAQMMDSIRDHGSQLSKGEMQERCLQALQAVDLRPSVFQMYPHQLSGGMKQRVCIAIGILLEPKVIVADEPTSALDVVTQRQVMETIDRVREQLGAAVILIGHDMGLMAQFVDKVAVFYAGQLMELCSVEEMFTNAMHPYAKALIESLPSLSNKGTFRGIPGLAPALLRLPSGCPFHPRCTYAMEICHSQRPRSEVRGNHVVACHLYPENTDTQVTTVNHG